MNTTVIITLIICITVIVVTALYLFSPGKDENSQKLRDINKVIYDFEDNYLTYDKETDSWTCKADATIIRSTFRIIDRIS